MTELKTTLGILNSRISRRRLYSYRPYPKQYEFHAATEKERLIIAGNQLGKTFGLANEYAMHLSGWYPDWWPGRKFYNNIIGWTGSETNKTSRDIIQLSLLGNPQGTGTIPGEKIKKVSTRQAGIGDVADRVLVKNLKGGLSTSTFMTYEMGRKKWMGTPVDVIWPDEECDYDIYSEALTRTQATKGMMMMSFTPMLGHSAVVNRFLEPEPGDPLRHVTIMTIYDCIGGVWPEGTPWAGEEWVGHYTKEEADKIISNYPEHERDTRGFGVPMMGEGKVFPVAESSIKFNLSDFPGGMPDYFADLTGIDFGIDHPAAGARISFDRHNDIIYVVDCYKQKNETIVYHAGRINAWGKHIRVAWPHDGMNRERSSGRKLKDMYRDHGCNMMKDSARYHNDKGGAQDVEPSINEMLERMKTGRFKVASHLIQWFDEFRTYHRKDGKIVAVGDDIMSSTRIAVMEKRHARTRVEQMPFVRKPRYNRPIVGGRM